MVFDNPFVFCNLLSTDRECAVEMGQALIDQHFGADINKHQIIFKDDETIYRLLEDDQSTALNAGTVSQCEPRPGSS